MVGELRWSLESVVAIVDCGSVIEIAWPTTLCYNGVSSQGRRRLLTTYLNLVEIIISIALILFILLQSKGAGFSGTFSTDSSVFRTRRGVEKTLFHFTLVLSGVFVLVSIASVLIGGPVG